MMLRKKVPTQWMHDIFHFGSLPIIHQIQIQKTSSLRQSEVSASFWGNNNVIITPSVRWHGIHFMKDLWAQAIWKQYFWIKIKIRPDHSFAQVTTSELLTYDLFGGLESKSQQKKCLQDLSYEPNKSLVNGSQIIFTARPSLLSQEDLPFYP